MFQSYWANSVSVKMLESKRLISSWTQLARMLDTYSTGRWLFRGEPRPDYVLKPKAGRVDTALGSARKKKYKLADEKKALELFQQQARPYLQIEPASELEWLAIAQHQGMATRLLDWTESLLVAAYFAVQGAGAKGRCGVIYCVNGLEDVIDEQRENPFYPTPIVRIYRPSHITPNIPAQRSVFTLHAYPESEYRPKALERWIVNHDICGQIKRILDSCAINEASLFPSLGGLARYVGWRYKWGKL